MTVVVTTAVIVATSVAVLIVIASEIFAEALGDAIAGVAGQSIARLDAELQSLGATIASRAALIMRPPYPLYAESLNRGLGLRA